MIRTPRERFVSSSHLSSFRKIAQTEAFEEATLTAMLEIEQEFPLECTPQQAADSHQQMIGARKYLDMLCSFVRPASEDKIVRGIELNYKAGV